MEPNPQDDEDENDNRNRHIEEIDYGNEPFEYNNLKEYIKRHLPTCKRWTVNDCVAFFIALLYTVGFLVHLIWMISHEIYLFGLMPTKDQMTNGTLRKNAAIMISVIIGSFMWPLLDVATIPAIIIEISIFFYHH